MYEPSNQQEAYDMAYSGFEFSEKIGEPILMRMVTRLAHSRSGVVRKPQQPQNEMAFSATLAPVSTALLGIARKPTAALSLIRRTSTVFWKNLPDNQHTDGPTKKSGIIAGGIGYNYRWRIIRQGCEYPVLKIGQYPLPKEAAPATGGGL